MFHLHNIIQSREWGHHTGFYGNHDWSLTKVVHGTKKAGMMNRYVTWVHLPKKKMAHWERLGEFSRIVAGGLREGRGG